MCQEYYDNFAAVRYHAWWPSSSDPFYRYNMHEDSLRILYYPPHTDGYYYTPYAWIDGNIRGAYNYNSWGYMMLARYDIPSPLDIQLSGMYGQDNREGLLNIDIEATGDIAYNQLFIMIALTESNIYYHGSNGLDYHNQVMRDMIPDAIGTPITISEGESIHLQQEFSCPDPIVERGSELVVFAQAPSRDGREILQGARIRIDDLVQTGVDEESEIPETFALEQNYPNPFNAETRIDFRTSGGVVALEIFDLTGSLVRTLVDGDLEAGYHSVVWDGRADGGAEAASGVYFYRLSTPDRNTVKRMTLIK